MSEHGTRYWLARLGLDVTGAQDEACRYLESLGMRFLVHFGYGNAEQKAREQFEQAQTTKGKPS